MFRSIFNSLSIYLQGTVFESRRHKGKRKHESDRWMEQHEVQEIVYDPPYTILQNGHHTKHDLISKLHGVDNHLKTRRVESKTGRAKWCQNSTEQNYNDPAKQVTVDPKVEIYWKALGLGHAKERELNW